MSSIDLQQGRFKAGLDNHPTCADFTPDCQLGFEETLLEKTPAYGLFKWLGLPYNQV